MSVPDTVCTDRDLESPARGSLAPMLVIAARESVEIARGIRGVLAYLGP
jgi:hypothetical protein